MSVLVKGMEIPESCRECPFENYYSDIGQTVCMASLRVLATGFGIIGFDGRHSSCPLVALPDKHGRLGDLDALIRDHFSPEHRIALSEANKTWMRKIINDAPTIVESEDGT